MLTSTAEEGVDKEGKNAAIKITYVNSLSCDPLLFDFYKQVQSVFEKTITELDISLPHSNEDRRLAIYTELIKLEPLLKKLDPEFVNVLRRSMRSYDCYISKAHQGVIGYFISSIPVDVISG